jgi:hypothetical protein
VQPISVPAPRRDDDRHEQIAGLGVSRLERAECAARPVVGYGLDRDRAPGDGLFLLLRHLAPFLHMRRALNLFADRWYE